MSTIRRRLIIAASQISKWLSKEACNTIKDAFGDDCKAVIKATDAYLDGLDASKAQAMASYINEDPMLVCSLGLQPTGVTMPQRYISCGDGTSDVGINSGINCGAVIDIVAHARIPNSGFPFRTLNPIGSYFFALGKGGSGYWAYGSFSGDVVVSNIAGNTNWHDFKYDNGRYYKVDDTIINSQTFVTNGSKDIFIVTRNVDVEIIIMRDPNTSAEVGRFVPCKHIYNGEEICGTLNLVNMQWRADLPNKEKYTTNI